MRRLWLWMLGVLAAGGAEARPVTYPGGVALGAETRAGLTEALGGYTLDPHAAVGADVARWSAAGVPVDVALATATVLPVKGNGLGWRANLYLTGGAGATAKGEAAYLGQADADVESLTLYASARIQRLWQHDTYERVRAGAAPFVAPMNALQIWLLAQWDYDRARRLGAAGPVVRFMYQTVLWEVGLNSRGEGALNWTVEY